MDEVIVFEWTFSPPDYFEEPLSINRDQHEIKIENGKVVARIKAEYYDQNLEMRDSLHESIISRFLGVQLLSHKSYQLSKPLMYRLYPNDRKDVYITVEPAIVVASAGSPDILVTDQDGRIVVDTRKERIEKNKTFSELVEKYRTKNSVVDALLGSYHAAVMDPDNELVHLYEIRDALASQFGRDDTARKALDISPDEWSKFGCLANKAPLKQGRHRGKKAGGLRNATEGELSEARTFSRRLIENFLKYLENKTQPPPQVKCRLSSV